MYQKGIQMVGTVQKNQLQKCPVTSDGDMKKKAWGTYVERVATIDSVVLSVVSWYGKVVTLLSNFVGSEPTTEVRRFSKKRNNISRFHTQKLLLYITNTWDELTF